MNNPQLESAKQRIELGRFNQLALASVTNPDMTALLVLRNYLLTWTFFEGRLISQVSIRQSVPVEQQPFLQDDGRNLSAVLFYLLTEHPATFEAIQETLRMMIPGLHRLTVKARGGPGEVIAFYEDSHSKTELTVADLSDGLLRLICWTVLLNLPSLPSLICIDEPDLGLHPRVLPALAEMFRSASRRTQILLATHSSYFLRQFDLSEIAIIRRQNGEPQLVKASDSKVLQDNLADFGMDELERMHWSEELEKLA